jgi:hypothetical protein
MSACCDAASDRKTPTWVRRIREVFAWILPSVILVSVPKCPVCLAAYVTLWTGLGLSLSTATYLRWALLFLSVASMLFLIVVQLYRFGSIFSSANSPQRAQRTQRQERRNLTENLSKQSA